MDISPFKTDQIFCKRRRARWFSASSSGRATKRRMFDRVSAIANVYSTLIGVPLAWGLMLIVELVVALPVIFATEKWHWQPSSPVLYLVNLFAVRITIVLARSGRPSLIASFTPSVRARRSSLFYQSSPFYQSLFSEPNDEQCFF